MKERRRGTTLKIPAKGSSPLQFRSKSVQVTPMGDIPHPAKGLQGPLVSPAE